MSVKQAILANLPYLRRYARALAGSQSGGDAYVAATLEAILADPSQRDSLAGGRVPLYRAFTLVWSSSQPGSAGNGSATGGHEAAAQMRLGLVTPLNRQALLLSKLEGFSIAQTAAILGLEPVEAERLVAEAVAEIDREATTSVLIIEDEPLISMQLEDLVSSLGHRICGTAATRTQAREAVADNPPGLVLADIQLADGSSGLDAADDIMAMAPVPVIFITAYPERLLTGNRPEPTYLVTKPFSEDAVRTAISQALFFGPNAPLA